MSTTEKTIMNSNVILASKQLSVMDRDREESHAPMVKVLHIDRINGDSTLARKINPKHVKVLVDAIVKLELIQPIAVDQNDRVLAGMHRYAALCEVRSKHPKVFEEKFPGGFVPVRVLHIKPDEYERKSKAIAICENQIRRPFTSVETYKLYKDLVSMGYPEADRGRLAKGETPILPAISILIGQTTRTVRRKLQKYTAELAGRNDEKATNGTNVPFNLVTQESVYAERLTKKIDQAIRHYEGLGVGAQDVVSTLQTTKLAIATLLASLAVAEPEAPPSE